MSNIKVNADHTADRYGFGSTNEELGKLTKEEHYELLDLAYRGNDKSILKKYDERPTAEEVAQYFEAQVLKKTAPQAAPVKTEAPKVEAAKTTPSQEAPVKTEGSTGPKP